MTPHPGKCAICSAPSGSGKTTIVHHLLKCFPQLSFSISATNRPIRDGERDGVDYWFLSTDEFLRRVQAHAFIEWEEVYAGRYYGTLKAELERIWARRHHVIFDVDVMGGLQLKEHFGPLALALFISPPSLSVLEQRLRSRGTENEDSLRMRLAKAGQEMEKASDFDAIIMNDVLSDACDEARMLVEQFLEP